MPEYLGAKDKTTWREIVLEHIRKILECSRVEFRGGFMQETGHNPTTYTYIFDTRQTYINGVNALADVLIPFFDKDMEEAFKTYEEKTTKKALNEEIPNHFTRSDNFDYEQKKVARATINIIYSRKLFQELNKLLRRTDYLKAQIYEEEE